ncbi:hypothetical protein SK128_001631 [Halocaridina rubra]|uniref:PIN domain-containing protein n=1 Tax=Halocaridina rubra TaxID=373956 RepID=A0AAN9A7S3_HALRR
MWNNRHLCLPFSQSADNLIRDACLLMQESNLQVVLLSNDINLRSKAHLSRITAIDVNKLKAELELDSKNSKKEYSSKMNFELGSSHSRVPKLSEIRVGVMIPEEMSVDLPETRDQPKSRELEKPKSCGDKCAIILKDVKTSLHSTLSNILEAAFKESYDDLWIKIILHKPPWTIEQVLTCWEKHWLAVFIDKYPSDIRDLLRKIRFSLNRANTNDELKTLVSKVESLYESFNKSNYKSLVCPITSSPVQDVTESESSTCKVGPSNEATPTNAEIQNKGVVNAKEMINLVGVHITHFLAVILDACGISHQLQRLNDMQMTPKNAHSSAIQLCRVIQDLGNCIVRCLNEATITNLQELGTLLVNFWNDAKESCPSLSFTVEDLFHLFELPDERCYLELVKGELERLFFMMKNLIKL